MVRSMGNLSSITNLNIYIYIYIYIAIPGKWYVNLAIL